MEFITLIYLIFMFVALYMFSFFILLTIRNRHRLYSYPIPNKDFFVSVIIPAYNEEGSIKDTVGHVMGLNYPKDKIEVIVLNDGSKDKTAEIVKGLLEKYENLKLINKKNSGKADSLNLGVREAKGELIAVVDSDSFPSPDSLKKLTGFFNDENMGAVTSFVSVRNKNDNFFAKIQSLEYLILGWSRKLLDFIDSVYVTNDMLQFSAGLELQSKLYQGTFTTAMLNNIKSLDEIVGYNWWRIFFPGNGGYQVNQLYRLIQKGHLENHEMTLTTKKRQLTTLYFDIKAEFAANGRLHHIECISN